MKNGMDMSQGSDIPETPNDMQDPTGPLDAIENLPELEGKPEGSEFRVEVIVKVTPDGVEINKANFISAANSKSKDEYLKMSPADRETYDKSQVMDAEDQKDKGADDPTEGN